MAHPFEVLRSVPLAGGWSLEVRLPEASALFAGHFPGRPILPGVAHLALVTRALADWRGERAEIGAVRSLRLRSPVLPGEVLEVRLREAADGGAGFEVRRGGEVVSNGAVAVRVR